MSLKNMSPRKCVRRKYVPSKIRRVAHEIKKKNHLTMATTKLANQYLVESSLYCPIVQFYLLTRAANHIFNLARWKECQYLIRSSCLEAFESIYFAPLVFFLHYLNFLYGVNQCDQIEGFLRAFGYPFSGKSSPNIWWLLDNLKTSLLKRRLMRLLLSNLLGNNLAILQSYIWLHWSGQRFLVQLHCPPEISHQTFYFYLKCSLHLTFN